MADAFKYFAFISYSSADVRWGKRLHRKLAGYRLPSRLCGSDGLRRKPFNPLFFAPYDIQPAPLSDELKKHLRESRHLLVICSPHSAKSDWVAKEIEYFHSLGRADDIVFFIIDGIPNSGDPATECFNPVVKRLGLPEYLGANIHEHVYRLPWLNRERAFVQIVSKMLNLDFDTLWRHRRRQMLASVVRGVLLAAAVVAAFVALFVYEHPFDMRVCLREALAAPGLPAPREIEVRTVIDGTERCDTVDGTGAEAVFAQIPGRLKGRQMRLSVRNADYEDLDTMLEAGTDVGVTLRRNAARYGRMDVRVLSTDGMPVADTPLLVEGTELRTDTAGRLQADIPLAKQKPSYRVQGAGGSATLYMPCAATDCIILK